MSSYSNQHLFKKTSFQSRKKRLVQKTFLQQLLTDLQKTNTRFSSYTITELEPICRKIAIHRMSSNSTSVNITCPWICLFCENFIYEPLTLYCGHTYCEECIANDESTSCPRCSKDLDGHVESSIVYARERHFSKNHFLKELFDRISSIRSKYENSSRCQQARKFYRNENYQQALEIYSNIIDKCNDEHLAFYGRARTYFAMKEFHRALEDVEQVILLRPQWAKGYYCRSEILFEMNRLTPALLSSLQGLTLNPEDQLGKQIMARHLHAVLQENENQPTTESLSKLSTSSTNKINSDATNTKLSLCKSPQSSSYCLCSLIDYKDLQARDFECSICVNLFWSPITTPCGHVFCRECLIRSVDNTQSQCPMCKSTLGTFFSMLIQSHISETELLSQMIQTYFPQEYHERQQIYIQENIQDASIPRHLVNRNEPIIFEIPIFVCVLTLPCCTCPLHVFEPRYRLMMRRTSETQSRTFGMCKYDEQTDSFADYGTLLFIRGSVFTQDGRSIVDTIGRQRFRVIDRGIKDGYDTARVQILVDHPIVDEEFDELVEFNRNTYNRVRTWFDQLDLYHRTIISRQLDDYPTCDDLIQGSTDGPNWSWIILNFLPIEPDLQYTALMSQSFRARLQIINDVMDYLLQQQQSITAISSTDDAEN